MEDACRMLTSFAIEFEEIYGPGALTMNIHLLKHYSKMIDHCGPIWAHSLFGFENNIGKLKRMVKGNTDYLHQIAKKYAIRTETKHEHKASPSQEFKQKKGA